MSPTKRNEERDRVNMRIPRHLRQWAKKYAQQMNTTVTQIFVDYLTRLKEYETSDKASPRPR